jgi:hypothetical protein
MLALMRNPYQKVRIHRPGFYPDDPSPEGDEDNMTRSRLISLATTLVLLVACTAYDHNVPDTAANLKGFERHFGFEAPADVTNVYYFADEMGADALYQVGFEASPETVARIVDALALTPSNPEELGLELAYDFSWWDQADIQQATCYAKSSERQDYWRVICYSTVTQRAYYLEYSL